VGSDGRRSFATSHPRRATERKPRADGHGRLKDIRARKTPHKHQAVERRRPMISPTVFQKSSRSEMISFSNASSMSFRVAGSVTKYPLIARSAAKVWSSTASVRSRASARRASINPESGSDVMFPRVVSIWYPIARVANVRFDSVPGWLASTAGLEPATRGLEIQRSCA
jgi:hypothetical protein